MTTAAEVVTMTSGGTPGATLRDSRSRAAENSTDTIASSACGVNADPPGRTISSTPMRPTHVAVHRRQPTWAPMNSAAPAVTASGTNCRMPKMSAIGMCTSAREEGDGAAEIGGGAPQHGRRQRVRQLAQHAAARR